jgi:hypothetical protein
VLLECRRNAEAYPECVETSCVYKAVTCDHKWKTQQTYPTKIRIRAQTLKQTIYTIRKPKFPVALKLLLFSMHLTKLYIDD